MLKLSHHRIPQKYHKYQDSPDYLHPVIENKHTTCLSQETKSEFIRTRSCGECFSPDTYLCLSLTLGPQLERMLYIRTHLNSSCSVSAPPLQLKHLLSFFVAPGMVSHRRPHLGKQQEAELS